MDFFDMSIASESYDKEKESSDDGSPEMSIGFEDEDLGEAASVLKCDGRSKTCKNYNSTEYYLIIKSFYA